MADIKHAVVRTDRMTGTDVRSQLISIKYMGSSGDTATEIDNGNVLAVDALIDGEREIYKGTDVTATSKVKDVVLIASVEVMYDERKKNLDQFVNEAGKVCRAYRFHSGDIFSVTAEALDASTPKVGNIVEFAAGTKLKVVTSATGGSTTLGKVIAIETAGRYTYYVVQVD